MRVSNMPGNDRVLWPACQHAWQRAVEGTCACVCMLWHKACPNINLLHMLQCPVPFCNICALMHRALFCAVLPHAVKQVARNGY